VTRERSETERQPSPETLRAEAAGEERRRLKVFVGAAPGVGKTYAMLQAAREQQRQGADIVVGAVETHGRPETQALLEGLEVIPRRRLEHQDQTLEELDLDAILARRPTLVIVDELAHTNAPGSRHPKRFQDVEELLDTGVNVYTTVNIQHLESLNDVVAQITGVRVRETIPDRVLDRADEIRLIDLSPEELLLRLREGKVYVPEQAERAFRNYFHPSNLTALRELALRETAEHVDDQMQAYMRRQPSEGHWAVAERTMVAVSGGPLAERLVRAGRRSAERRDAPWLAVFVEPPRFQRRPEAERQRVMRALRLAEQLGGEAVVIPGQHVAEELARYARRRHVSEIIVGGPARSGWRARWRPSVVARLIQRRGPIDVRVLSAEAEGAQRPENPLPGREARAKASLRGYALAAALVAAAGLAAAGVMAVLPLRDPGMLFLAAVLLSAVGGGLEPSIFASILSVLVYDFFFTEPFHSLRMTDPQDYLSLAAFLIVAVLTSHLTARVRDQADAARRREARAAALYAFGRAITGAATIDDLCRAIATHAAHALGAAAAVLLPEAGRLMVHTTYPADMTLGAPETATATWAWQHDQPAGRGTATLPGGGWLHVPLSTVRGAVGVLAVHVERLGGRLALEQQQLLEALTGQAALAIERSRVDVVEAIIESIEDGLVVLDREGIIVHVNDVACAILDCGRTEVLGHRFDALGTHHPHYIRLRGAVHDFLTHPEREKEGVELVLFHRGRDHCYVLRPTPFRDRSGVHAGHILVLQDVTHLRDHEARREQLMATLSHELRTPLASQRLAVELLERALAPLEGRRGELVAAVKRDVERLEDVAQRLLEVSRGRAMTIALERQTVDLRVVLARVGEIFAFQAAERGIAFETTAPEGGLTITGDATKLTWALSNLVTNALRYTPRGGCVTVAAVVDDGTVRVAVSDSGPGIPPDQRERIFERFVQGQEGPGGVAGLGLAIVRDIVQAHGGRIHLESEVGRGSRFTLDLPRG
jgi:two-component system, OmpR family, sensor histidine kinase KdpD